MLSKTRRALHILLMLVVSLFIGFGLTYFAVGPAERSSALSIGPWHAWQYLGTENASPYVVARHVQSGQLPLGANEGIVFFASEDSSGTLLDSNCSYSVDGLTPIAKLWTLTAYDTQDNLNVKLPWKTSINSRRINRRADGSFRILISDTAHSGNWLPVERKGALKLVLRLYDTPIATSSSANDRIMPIITREKCT